VPDLRSAIGNRALARLLQRQSLKDEIIRNLGPVPDPKEWTKERTGEVTPLYAEIATLAKADRSLDVKGTTKADINVTRDARKGEKDIKPGLNYVAKLTGKGECGFVDGQGVFRGPTLPVSLDGPLPKVAILLGPAAFQQGKDGALGTLRHEMKHVEHFKTMIDWLARWRQDVAKQRGAGKLDDAAARQRFDAWVDRHKGIGKVDHALLLGERAGSHANTELLAYVEGFINIWHLRQDPPALTVGYDYPPALYQLRRAGEEYNRAASAVKAVALDRLREYVKTVLTTKEQAHLKTWLVFLSDNARAQATNPPAGQESVAKLVHNDFKPVADFLKQLLALVP
jgi:hypothetical protein